jgi:hypothetical protein
MLTGERKNNLSHRQLIYRGLRWFRYGLVVSLNTLLYVKCDKCLEQSRWKAVGYPPCILCLLWTSTVFIPVKAGVRKFSKNLGCSPKLWYEPGTTVTRRRGPKYSRLGYVRLKIYAHPVLPVLFQPHTCSPSGSDFSSSEFTFCPLVSLHGKAGDLLNWHKWAYFLCTGFYVFVFN